MDVPHDLVEQFVTLTHADALVASQLLGDNHLDLEAAIASFYAIQDAGGTPADLIVTRDPAAPDSRRPTLSDSYLVTPLNEQHGQSSNNGNAEVVVVGDDDDEELVLARAEAFAADEALARQLAEEHTGDDVRAPIPQQVDRILPDSTAIRTRVRGPRGRQLVNDPFLRSDGTAHGDTLAELFRPPVHLNCQDDLDQAMRQGQEQRRWILVNMQRSDVFQCHVLNRDVWSDPAIIDLLRARFLFWQRDESTEDGRRYKQFYPYDEPPHVAVIDPRSGERLCVCGGNGNAIKKDVIINALVDFSDRYSLEDGHDRPVPHPSSQQVGARTRSTPAPRVALHESGLSVGPSGTAEVDHLERDVMETEDAQIAAAIAASMEQTTNTDPSGLVDDNEDDDVVETGVNEIMRGPMDVGGTVVGGPSAMDRQASRILSATDPELNNVRSLRAQQDSEYEESLALDRAKSESEKEGVARAQQAASRLEAKRARLPAVPADDASEPTTELVVRLPSGRRLQRRFYASDKVSDVYDFVDIESGNELSDDSYALVVPFPRASLTDRSQTLQSANVPKRTALVVDIL